MAYLMTQASSTPNPCSSVKLAQIIDDLGRLSTTIQNLTLGTDTQLSSLPIGDQLATIHDCLSHFEQTCQSLSNPQDIDVETAETNGWGKIVILDEKRPDWRPIRTQAQRANRLALDLSNTLSKLRGNLAHVPAHAPVPADISRLNQSLNATVESLFTEWNSYPY